MNYERLYKIAKKIIKEQNKVEVLEFLDELEQVEKKEFEKDQKQNDETVKVNKHSFSELAAQSRIIKK